MKWFKRILWVLAIIIALILIIAIFLSSSYKVERSVVINANEAKIMSQIVDFKKWDFWSPWKPQDTAAKYTYNDTVGVGAFMSWKGEIVGEGQLRITEIIPMKSIKYYLKFIEPFASESIGTFSFETQEKGTKVTWADEGKLPWPIGRWMGVIMDFDKTMGPDFEKGLVLLKDRVEKLHNYTYDIMQKTIEAQTIAGIREKVEAGEISKLLAKNYGLLISYIAKNGATCTGQPMAITVAWDSLTWDFIAALPIDKEIPSVGKIKIEKFYSGKVIYVVYKGAYDKTYNAYMDLEAYVKENNLTEAGGPWEVYITDPVAEPDTSKWVTEIYFPIKD